MTTDSTQILRRLTLGDRALCRSLVAAEAGPGRVLDTRTLALVRLVGTMVAGSSSPIWQQRVNDALESGLSFDEIVEALTALAPTIGTDRLVAIAPQLSRALGYDVDAALERLET